MINRYKEIFKDFDLVASPTMPILPPRIDKAEELSPIQQYMSDYLTVPPNLAGMPHISLPISHDKSIGMQFIANHFNEALLFNIGKLWENIFEYKFPERIGEIK